MRWDAKIPDTAAVKFMPAENEFENRRPDYTLKWCVRAFVLFRLVLR